MLAVIVGRFAVSAENAPEIETAVAAAFRMAGVLTARIHRDAGVETRTFRRGLFCPRCGKEFRDPTPALFAFNSPLGACSTCQGFGRVIGIDWEKVIPNRDLTLDERPVAPWNTPAYESAYADLFKAGRKIGLRRPFRCPPCRARARAGRARQQKFYGISGFFEWPETKRYRSTSACSCRGTGPTRDVRPAAEAACSGSGVGALPRARWPN